MSKVKFSVEYVLLMVLEKEGAVKDYLCIPYVKWRDLGIGFDDLVSSSSDVESAILTVNLQSGALSYHKAFSTLTFHQFLKKQLDHCCLVVPLPAK